MSNFSYYFDEDGQVKQEQADRNRWLAYLTHTDNICVNAERLERMRDLSGRETVEYVMRTLDVLDERMPEETCKDEVSRRIRDLIREVLCWSEVAKGGLRRERTAWKEKGYPLDIHNVASAAIYRDHMQMVSEERTDRREDFTEAVALLILTHGLIGQCIRGETPVCHNEPLLSVREQMGFTAEEMQKLLLVLNECIIRGVNDGLWEKVKRDAEALICRILAGDLSEYSAEYRLEKLCPGEISIYKEDARYFADWIFPYYELWYFESALGSFDMKQIRTILDRVAVQASAGEESVEHLNFKPLADSLYYDYEDKRHINVYKKRIIEKYLREGELSYVSLKVGVENGTAYVDFCFAPVCEKLIAFCEEAERSGFLTFEKSIIVLYDMFGFRKDEFDRLNNEEKYLLTMNDVSASTKDGIIDHVAGKSVVDVGSGGGVLLDRLEAKYPGMEVIGTDISVNVIEALEQKKKKEGHRWKVRVHNFVEGVFPQKADSIIFSSILHEIFSYTEGNNGRFDIESVKKALRNAYESLQPGGRIIIRDGVKTDGNAVRKIRFKSVEGMDFFKHYVADFKGLPEIPEGQKVLSVDEESLTVTGNVNMLREFMYTYTWGVKSYAHEVQEQFGYFTLSEYREFLASLGVELILARELLEPGYPEHLNGLLTLLDENENVVEYPASNCILVVEKPRR